MQRPNVLIIHTDQQRIDTLGAYGNKDVRTPNIDALAADGVTYRNSFCCYPVCTPSRYSLLTGLYVHQHLGWNNRSTLPSGLATVPRILKQAGYRTKAVGKMHFTPTYLDVGFEEMELAEQDGPGRYDDDYHRHLQRNGLADRLDLIDQVREFRKDAPQEYWESFGAVESDLPEEHHSTTWIGDRAAEAMGQWSADRPNLLMVGFIKPHHPMDPPAPWSRMYDPRGLTLLDGWTESPLPGDLAFQKGYFDYTQLTEERLRRAMAMYYATVSQIDHHVGRMIDLLKQRRLYDDTLIIFTSDHGDYLGFHHMILKGNHMYDPLVKVPLIVKHPGRAGAGGVSDALVSNVDLAPTILARCGCPRGEFMTGLDLGGDAAGRELIFAEARRGCDYMARSRTRKLLLCKDPAESQFFNLEADPLEMRNLLDDPGCESEIEELASRIAEWALFESPTPLHQDEHAPIIPAANALSPADGHRPQIEAYFADKVKNAAKAVIGKKD